MSGNSNPRVLIVITPIKYNKKMPKDFDKSKYAKYKFFNYQDPRGLELK